MPTDRSEQRRYNHRGLMFPNRPWHARAKIRGISHHLGHYATYEEALQVENEFREANPGRLLMSHDERQERNRPIIELSKQGDTAKQLASRFAMSASTIRWVIKNQ